MKSPLLGAEESVESSEEGVVTDSCVTAITATVQDILEIRDVVKDVTKFSVCHQKGRRVNPKEI